MNCVCFACAVEDQLKRRVNEMFETSLLDLVLTTIGVLLLMALISCLCCLCMKFSDLKLKLYIIKTAKKKGLAVDIDKLEMKPSQGCESPLTHENCTIMVPEVGIIL